MKYSSGVIMELKLMLQLRTSRLQMRPFTRDDLGYLHRLWTKPEVRKYLWDDDVISREKAAEVIVGSVESFRADGTGFWVVELLQTGEPVGFCGLRWFGDPSEVEVLYGLEPAHRGKGYATEAVRGMIRYGFVKLGLDRIYAGADLPNKASFGVMERIGMTFDKRMIIDGRETLYYVLESGSWIFKKKDQVDVNHNPPADSNCQLP